MTSHPISINFNVQNPSFPFVCVKGKSFNFTANSSHWPWSNDL